MNNHVYGYARISTRKQKAERQTYNIKKEYPDAIIFIDEFTGTTLDRPAWNKLIKKVKAGDSIIFDEVSRMSRNAAEGFRLYEELYCKGVNLEFIKEPHLNTSVYRETLQNRVQMTDTDVDCILEGVNQYLMILAKKQIEIAFKTAEHEVEYLHQRTSEGVRRAIANGKKVGRPQGAIIETAKAKAAKTEILRLSKAFNGTLTDKEAIKVIGCDRKSYYKYKAELKRINA